jgi:excisionase family DNA binding protein
MTYSVKQTADRIGVSASLVYALCRDGVLPHTRHGRAGKRGCIRITEEAVAAYVEASRGEGRHRYAPLDLRPLSLG